MISSLKTRGFKELTTQSVVRILIASYFLAFSLGVFPGTDVAILLTPFFTPAQATLLSHIAVFSMALMILLGYQRRAAALVLAITVFWASYMSLMSTPTADGIGSFWRDLALIGALILTYSQPISYSGTRASFVRSQSRTSPSIEGGRPTSSRLGIVSRLSRPRSRTVSQKKAEAPYREDLSAARSS